MSGPCAFVVPAPGSEPTLDELTAHLEEAGLTRYKWPETLHLLDALPHGATGKVDRKGLRERAKHDRRPLRGRARRARSCSCTASATTTARGAASSRR